MDIGRVLATYNIGTDNLLDAFAGVDLEQALVSEDQVGAVVQAFAPSLDPAVKSALSSAIFAGVQPIGRAYAASAAAMITESQLRPNTAVTLYAGDSGELQLPGEVYSLRPRIAGELSASDFKFTETMSFHRATVDERDADLGFNLVGNTWGFADERAKVFPYDVSVAVFRPDIDVMQTPLASLMNRSPDEDRDFTGAIILNGDSAAEFGGMTLIITDTECTANSKNWINNLNEFDFGELAQYIASHVASSRPRPTQQRPPVLNPRNKPMIRPKFGDFSNVIRRLG